MTPTLPAPRQVSPAEKRADRAVHLAGLGAAAVAVPALLAFAVLRGAGAGALAATAVYAATLLAMLGASALYHMAPRQRWARLLLSLDHAAIHFKIAGTYTPFAVFAGGQGAGLVAALWALAVSGSGLRAVRPGLPLWAGLAIYLTMGWAGVAAGSAMLGHLSALAATLLVIGGTVITLGVVIFAAERPVFHTAIWHLCVLLGSALFFAAIAVELAAATAPTAMPE